MSLPIADKSEKRQITIERIRYVDEPNTNLTTQEKYEMAGLKGFEPLADGLRVHRST